MDADGAAINIPPFRGKISIHPDAPLWLWHFLTCLNSRDAGEAGEKDSCLCSLYRGLCYVILYPTSITNHEKAR